MTHVKTIYSTNNSNIKLHIYKSGFHNLYIIKHENINNKHVILIEKLSEQSILKKYKIVL